MSEKIVPFSAAWQQVECSGCGREYQCMPEDDYYHRPDVANEDRTVKNGVCQSCLIGGMAGTRRCEVAALTWKDVHRA